MNKLRAYSSDRVTMKTRLLFLFASLIAVTLPSCVDGPYVSSYGYGPSYPRSGYYSSSYYSRPGVSYSRYPSRPYTSYSGPSSYVSWHGAPSHHSSGRHTPAPSAGHYQQHSSSHFGGSFPSYGSSSHHHSGSGTSGGGFGGGSPGSHHSGGVAHGGSSSSGHSSGGHHSGSRHGMH